MSRMLDVFHCQDAPPVGRTSVLHWYADETRAAPTVLEVSGPGAAVRTDDLAGLFALIGYRVRIDGVCVEPGEDAAVPRFLPGDRAKLVALLCAANLDLRRKVYELEQRVGREAEARHAA